jgi:hypothetical protein
MIEEQIQKERRKKESARPIPFNLEYAAELKQQKRLIASKLKETLRAIDETRDFDHGPQERVLSYNSDGVFEWHQENQIHRLTVGDALTDIHWGIHYYPQKEIPRLLRKKLAIERAKVEIAGITNKELIQRRISNNISPDLRAAYLRIERTTPSQFEHSAGLIFERMISNLVRQLMVDKHDWGIEIEDVNVVEDVERKIDFIVILQKHTRGAAIEESQQEPVRAQETTRVVFGVQFTLQTGFHELQWKRHQLKQLEGRKRFTSVKPLDDVILISVPTSSPEILKRYQQWQQLGKPPGGPEALWDNHTKIEFLKALTRGMGIDDLLTKREGELIEYYNSRISEIPE